MVWSAKKIEGRDRQYIVIRHKLRDVDDTIAGVRFRRGFAVVDKSTKIYTTLRKLPFLKNALEFPLVHLQNLPFIINDRQVDIIYGRDVYSYYVEAKKEYLKEKKITDKAEAIEIHLQNDDLCKHIRVNGGYCKGMPLKQSPSGYCKKHIVKDPRLEEVGLKVPSRLSKDEQREWKEKILKKLKIS